MAIDHRLLERIRSHIASKFHGGMQCPLCRRINWDAVAVVATPSFDASTNAITLGRTLPVVALACQNCGGVQYILLSAIPEAPE